MTPDAQNFGWVVESFTQNVPGVRHTMTVSTDGLLVAMSAGLDRSEADQFAALVSGLSALTNGAARQLDGGGVRQVLVEMDQIFLVVMAISDGSVLAVVADEGCDIGLVGYEMTMLAARARDVLTPALIHEIRKALPTGGRVPETTVR
nr:roadblock/LC7 domain-containing protein [Cellulomonas triticagri]